MPPLSHIFIYVDAWFISLGLIALGLRGRRVNDHPYCRRCGFDVFGLPANSSICSECGRDLNVRRAIRHGARKRRSSLLALGLIFLVPVATGTALLARDRARQVKLTPHKPVWWLLHDAADSDPTLSNAAFDELLHRQTRRRRGDGADLPA